MSEETSIENLRRLLEGKTIVKIEEPNASEAICKFILSDGSSFRLHATELGYWTEETANVGGEFRSLTAMMREANAYCNKKSNELYPSFEQFDQKYDLEKGLLTSAKISVSPDVCEISLSDGMVFRGDLSYFSEFEKKVLSHPQGKKLLDIGRGQFWKMAFSDRNEDCPPELWFFP